jgi:hypothetical protein
MVVSVFTGVPGSPALDAMLGDTKSYTVSIRNTASNANGNNIRSNSDPNFKLQGYFAKSAAANSPTHQDKVGNLITMSSTSSLLGQGIVGGTTITNAISGTMSLPALTIAQCDDVTHVCVYVSLGNDASFIDTDSSDNYKCQSLNKICRPGEIKI